MSAEVAWLLVGNLTLFGVLAGVCGRLLYGYLKRIPPSAYAEMEAAMADFTRQMSDMRQQQAADHATIRQLRGEMNRIEEIMYRWQEAYMAVAREFRTETGRMPSTQPPAPADFPTPVAAAQPAGSSAALADTSQRLATAFSIPELNDLAMEIGLLEVVAGDSLEERASSLSLAALRRGVLSELRAIARRERPRGGF